MSKPGLKAEAIRLRVEERLPLREIVRRTQASKGAVSLWLRPYPLSEEERRALARKNHYSPATLRKERGAESPLHKVVAGQNLTVFEKMRIAEAAVLLRLTLHRFRVFGPVFDGDEVDWLAEDPATGVRHKIQVRWASKHGHRHGLPDVSLRCKGPPSQNKVWRNRRFREGAFDFLVGYDLYTDTAYVWSWKEVEHLTHSVTIAAEAAERWDKLRSSPQVA